MKCQILHQTSGRIRIHICKQRMTETEADILEYYLNQQTFIIAAKVYDRTGDVIIRYAGDSKPLLQLLSRFSFSAREVKNSIPEQSGRQLNKQYEEKLIMAILRRALSKLFLPPPIRMTAAGFRAAGYIRRGFHCLRKGRLEVAVLDATAVGVSMLKGNYKTAASIMFLLKIGEILEEWTHKKSVNDLAQTMSLNIDKVWKKTAETELLVPLSQIQIDDEIIVRTGNVIPLDGKVTDGEAMVNQASITGEPLSVRKSSGAYVYAGTVVEEGTCVIQVTKNSGNSRYDRIIKMIEESEKLKSTTESQAAHLADRLVPYSLGGTLLTYLLTRNMTKALSILMVDFSCALKLAMPIAVLSAIRECSTKHIAVKGGCFLEAVAEADTIVFDKTGTLTHASPNVAKIITFGDHEEEEMLRLAACLEEHYPHSIANAVVSEAKRRNLNHEERHSSVEYVVAHGISSQVDDEKVIIGSYHFVFQDEQCAIPQQETEKFNSLPAEYSHLYLAIAGELAAVICISDPLREEAAAVISQLPKLGFKKVVMMTGDNEKTASSIAKAVGITEFYAEILPEDKANFIRSEHAAGRKVIMIGDGINDSPALSEADAGIAVRDGAAIAREVADITIAADDLSQLLTLKTISDRLMNRIHGNYRFIISFNLSLIFLGVLGILQPATSALLHNLSTLGISLYSMTNLLEKSKNN